jgi:Fe-S oxidoreductase
MGWLPLWLQAAGRMPKVANAAMTNRVSAALLKRAGGIAPERRLPAVADETFVRWFARRPAPAPGSAPGGEPVVLFADSFTNHFDPGVGKAAVAVLEALGYRVEVPTQALCCGLTWLSTGQLGMARRTLQRTLGALDRGLPVIGLEPSCTALLRSDAGELVPGAAAEAVGEATRTFAEFVDAALAAGRGGHLSAGGGNAVAQTHCHQYAEMGFDADRSLLGRLGVETDVLDSGCCGLAGNFGFEKGHYGVSMAAGERVLLPAVRRAGDETAVLADGFSCRTQIRQATRRQPVHLAELAASQWGLTI